MRKTLLHVKILTLIGILMVSTQPIFAQTLQERLDRIQGKIEEIKAFDSLRMNVRNEYSNNIGKLSSAKIEEGEFVILSGKTLFKYSSFNASNLDECRNKKNARNEEILARIVKTSDHDYIQSGDGNMDDVKSIVQKNSIFSNELMFVYDHLEKNLNSLNETSSSRQDLSSITHKDFKQENNIEVNRYELRWPNGDDAETITCFDFSKNSENPLPVFMACSNFFKTSGKSYYHWTLSIKTDGNSPIGFTAFEFASYNVPSSLRESLDEQQFINDPNKFLKRERFSHVTIIGTPVVNGPVFPEEFNFFIPKGRALVIRDLSQKGSKPQRIVAEEDRVFTP